MKPKYEKGKKQFIRSTATFWLAFLVALVVLPFLAGCAGNGNPVLVLPDNATQPEKKEVVIPKELLASRPKVEKITTPTLSEADSVEFTASVVTMNNACALDYDALTKLIIKAFNVTP